MKKWARCLMSGTSAVLMLVMLAGCGGTGGSGEGTEESVELREPGGSSEGTEPVVRRNLYKAAVYEGAVYPYVEEYSFPEDQYFGSYGALLGDAVREGDPLVFAEDWALQEKEEALQEKMEDLTRDFEKFRAKKEEILYEQRLELESLASILENLKNAEPDEYIVGSLIPPPEQPPSPEPGDGNVPEAEAGSAPEPGAEAADNPEEAVEETADWQREPALNPEYASWQAEYRKWEGEYNLKEWSISVNEEELRQHRELYELDYGHYNAQLQELRIQAENEVVYSGISGQVVDLGYYTLGARIPRGKAVAAVADMEQKYIKCSSIERYLLANATDTYAFIGGRRYEVSFQQMDRGMASFSLTGGTDEVSIGDYGVLVLVSDRREQVLTVPVNSVYTEGTEEIVYVVEDGQNIPRQVKTGMSDGIYVEILSGLEEGEKVMAETRGMGMNTAVLERGNSEISYTGTAYLYFPVKTMVWNPVEHGKVIMGKGELGINQHVEKGEVLTSITVQADRVDIASREAAVRRAKERLADLEAKGREEDRETIAEQKEEIAEQEQELARIKADSEVTEILSPVSGLLEFVNNNGGMVLEKEGLAAVVADESVGYLMTDISQNAALNYGQTLTITYEDDNGEVQKAECRCLTLGQYGTSEDFMQDYAMLGVSEETLANLPRMNNVKYGYPTTLYRPTGFVNRMKDVVLVPLKAVTQTAEGRTYVNIVREDGSVMPAAFLAGGKDKDYYWVLEGLTEGMKICWE